MDVTVKEYQPWQLGLFHPDLTGKYVWYPKKGTLMYESDEGIANVGEFLASKDTTEDVVNVIMRKVLEQQNS